jgi:peptidoglycan/LPS O-acetylase OafA/YrhL
MTNLSTGIITMTPQKKQRLLGIDLVRGIASYAVIQVHSGDETWGLPVDPSAITFRLLFYFAVPFFLAASFFFSVRKTANSNSWSFWKSKIERILIPYAVWSLLYLVFRVTFFLIAGKSAKLQALLSDPLSIFFFGGASYQLYFLPLLFAGTWIILLSNYLEKQKISTKRLVLLAILSTLLYEVLMISGNDFQLGADVAFTSLTNIIAPGIDQNNLIRFIFVQIAWSIRCLPYVFFVMLLHRWLIKVDTANLLNSRTSIFLFGLFLLVNVLKNYFPTHGFSDILIAFSLLLAGISISEYLGDNKILKNLGVCSFGIYLIHPIAMNFVEPIIYKIFPVFSTQVSILSMLAFCIPTFLLSWLAVYSLRKQQLISVNLLGI